MQARLSIISPLLPDKVETQNLASPE